jgi:hypothetical protein
MRKAHVAALRARHQHAPESAWATHLAWTETSGPDAADPFRGSVHRSLAGRKLAAEQLLAAAARHSEVFHMLRSAVPIEIVHGW